MILNHLNLTVTDVPAAQQFLEKYFGLRNRGEIKRNEKFMVLFDDRGLVLTLMKAREGEEVRYPGFFHIGFAQESEEQVNELNRRLKADGFAAGYTCVRTTPSGATGVVCPQPVA